VGSAKKKEVSKVHDWRRLKGLPSYWDKKTKDEMEKFTTLPLL
jgi:hypothetical protein